eukprot:6810161-Pyramimonas_sp.AAC.1
MHPLLHRSHLEDAAAFHATAPPLHPLRTPSERALTPLRTPLFVPVRCDAQTGAHVVTAP